MSSKKAPVGPDDVLVFDHETNIQTVELVGCGGTGAQLARSLCRTLWDLQQRGQHAPKLRFFDPDVVEKKNVGRQLFVASDIGKNKAEVLARRFGLALGLQIEWIAKPYDAKLSAKGGKLIVGCVDGHEGRMAMARELEKRSHALWLDCGNHDNAGQVILGNDQGQWTRVEQAVKEIVRATRDDPFGGGKVQRLPSPAVIFPDLLKASKKPRVRRGACAEDVAAGRQALLINDLMAAVASQYVYKLLNHQPVDTFMTYIDGDGINVRSKQITINNLKSALGMEE